MDPQTSKPVVKRLHGRDGSETWGGYPKHVFMLLGEHGCGKSTIFARFKHYKASGEGATTTTSTTRTIDFANRTLELGDGKQKATLQCWDTPSPTSYAEPFFNRKYYGSMDSLVFVYNNKRSFKSIERQMPGCRSKTKATFFLVSNKFDGGTDWDTTGDRVERLVKQYDMKFVELSAHHADETEILFQEITKQLEERMSSYRS